MSKFAARFCALCERFSLLVARAVMAIICVIVAVMIWEVVVRYVFEKPTLWANELSLWLAGAVYLLAGLYAMRERAHIRVTIFYDSASRNWRRAMDGFAALVLVVFAVALVVGSWKTVMQTVLRWETLGTAWDPPVPATVKPLILIAVSLIAVQSVSNFIADFNRDKPGPPEDSDSAPSETGAPRPSGAE